MAKAAAKKKQDIENELLKHSDLISDTKVKSYIQKKKEEKRQKDLAKWQSMGKDVEMIEEESEESVEEVMVEKIKPVKKTKTIKKKN